MNTNYLSFLNDHKKYLDNAEGLPDEEIQALEIEFSVLLPAAYREFLSFFGRRPGQLLSSYLVTIDKLKGNRESAIRASHDELTNKSVEVKASYFFFGQWQGYNFFFFDCAAANDNPAVYILADSPEIYKYKETFTDFVKEEGLNLLHGT
jgi:hypothetical protein